MSSCTIVETIGAAPFEEYVLILLIFDETNGNSLIPLGSECWA